MDAKMYSLKEKSMIKTVKLPENVFNVKVNEHCIYENIKEYLNNNRQGTASTKTRVEVSGGGRKPWRQKGLGRARAGTIRSPLWVGGGITFGPKPRDYYYRINKKTRAKALTSALTLKAQDNKVLILTEMEMQTPKTKLIDQLLKEMEIKKGHKKLFIFEKYDENIYKSIRNIEGALPIMAHEINTYIIMNADFIIISETALNKIKEVYGK